MRSQWVCECGETTQMCRSGGVRGQIGGHIGLFVYPVIQYGWIIYVILLFSLSQLVIWHVNQSES